VSNRALLVALPLAVVLLVYILHRWRIAFWLAGLASGLTGYLCFRVAQGSPLASYGLYLEANQIRPIGVLFGIAAFSFILGAFLPASPYIPFSGLLSTVLMSASLLLPPGMVSGILLTSAFVASVIPLYEGKRLNPTGTVGLLLLSLLPFLSFTLVRLGLLPLRAWSWTFLSLFPLLGFLPFHLWVVGLLRRCSPLSAGFILTVLRLGVVLWIGRMWETQLPPGNLEALLWGLAFASLIWSGVRGFASRSFAELTAYAATADAGVLLGLLMAQGNADAPLRYLAVSALGVLVLTGGITLFNEAQDSGHNYPQAVSLLLAGVLSVAGLPLTPGFAARMMALNLLKGKAFCLLIILSGFGLLVGGMRLLRPYLSALRLDEELQTPSALVLLLLVLSSFVLLGINPWL